MPRFDPASNLYRLFFWQVLATMCEDQPVWEVLSDAKAEMAVVTHASNSDPAIAQAALRCLIALARYLAMCTS